MNKLRSRPRPWALGAVVATLAVAALWPTAAAQQAGAEKCIRRELAQPPKWTVSGAWKGDSQLVFVDALADLLVTYDLDGRRLPATPAARAYQPSLIQAAPGGFLLESRDGRMAWLDHDLELSGTPGVDLMAVDGLNGHKIRAVFAWALSGDEIVMFGDVENPQQVRGSAFLRVPLERPETFQILVDIDGNHPDRNYYRLGLSMLAATREGMYFLAMDRDQPEVGVVTRFNKAPLRRLPLPVPGLPPSTSGKIPWRAGDLPTQHFAHIEMSSGPVGLYASSTEDAVYVLHRAPAARTQGTKWSLSRFDVSTGTVERTATLPTSANHLVVVPGARYWAFLEKGPVVGLGVQEITHLLLIPTGWIEGSASPLAGDEVDFSLCE
jgi:hypothetical protein